MINFSKKKYLLLSNVLDKNFENTLEQLFLSPNFPWYYGEGTIKKSTHLHLKKIKNFRIIDYLHFSHTFYKFNFDKNLSEINSDFYYFVLDILKNVCVKLNYDNKIEILRAKVNLQTQHKNINKNIINTPHNDFENPIIPHIVIIYYVNDNDGKTYLFKKNGDLLASVIPKKGNFLIFDGNILHAGSNPLKSKKKLLINIDIRK